MSDLHALIPSSPRRRTLAGLAAVGGFGALLAFPTPTRDAQITTSIGVGTPLRLAANAAPPPPTAQLNFPTQGPRPGSLRVTTAFPNMPSFSRPVFLGHAGDGTDRVFVVQQAGQIFVFPNVQQGSTRTQFLNIQSKVSSPSTTGGNEEGLLGLAFHPNYETNGYFYVYYSATSPRRSVIARYRVSPDPNVADPASEFILMTVAQPFSNHNGGWMGFGPDDKLYIALGDGGSGGDPQGNGQNTNTLLGKILRIDVDTTTGALNYGIPHDNPFVGHAGYREEIYALGLRNPWRNSFDRQTGDLWAGDVGQGAREEIDLIRPGGNYGWNVFEGNAVYRNPNNLPPSMFDAPVIDYVRSLASSITGGYVYRGRFSEMRGLYLHGDYGTGNLWALLYRNGAVVSNTLAATASSVASFGEDQHGEVYAISLGGVIQRIEPSLPGGGAFPENLSATGLFADLASLTPAPGVLPYEVNYPFWSDHAEKRRFVSWPGSAYTFHPTDAYSFPVGTVFVKHMEIETVVGVPSSKRRLETRVLVHEIDGWFGYTYRWNTAQTDARLISDRETEVLTIHDQSNNVVRTQTWTYPSRTDCLQCHTQADGRVLGFRTRQLNRSIVVNNQTVNQLEHFDGQQMFTTSIGSASQYQRYPAYGDTNAPIAEIARTHLAVNCSACHRTNGTAPSNLDLRYGIPEAQMNAFDVRPSQGDLGLPDAYVIKTGVRESSVLFERMRTTDAHRMPPIATNVVDADGVDRVGRWIGTAFETFGNGCAGSAGTPSLSVSPGAWPRIGNNYVVAASNVPAGQMAAMVLGFSRTAWVGVPLPIDLAPIGMPGCPLSISPDIHLPTQVAGSTATLTLAIPNDASLLGARFYNQAFVTSPGSNSLGIVTSDAATAVVVR